MVRNRFVIIINSVAKLFAQQILGRSRMDYGFGLFCVGLFTYLSFLGVSSIFPYIFCITAHFSHNFCISIVL